MDERNDTLRDLRTRAGWSLRRAGKALGLDQGWLSQIETGLRPLSSRLVERMAALYSTPPDNIVTAEDVLGAAALTRERAQAAGVDR
jgi:transcriptional regulator with XRE-family HTH domain